MNKRLNEELWGLHGVKISAKYTSRVDINMLRRWKCLLQRVRRRMPTHVSSAIAEDEDLSVATCNQTS